LKPRLLDILVCPDDHASLELEGATFSEDEHHKEILSGELHCPSCQRRYPIEDGIPKFTSPDHYSASFGLQWNRYAKTQLDSHSGHSISKDRYLEVCRWTQQNSENPWALEAGCGAGRFSEVLSEEDKEWVCVDASSAVDANAKNNGHRQNIHIVQADLRQPPFKPQTFGRMFCLGVLQHTPDPERSFFSLLPLLDPKGGEFAFDIYAKTKGTWCWSKYWLRPITKRIPKATLFKLLSWTVPVLLRCHDVLRWIPCVGRYLAHRLIPVCQYKYSFPFDAQQNLEWALLDTFDMLAPEHDHPKRLEEVQAWLDRVPHQNSQLRYGPNGIVDCITLCEKG
jgi:uncharacterized protein YbaR (Trm112 family)/2-polyprenyl-3-methyl-5-hydroxy-6-metoxy-1,4-benzoquinol methylase